MQQMAQIEIDPSHVPTTHAYSTVTYRESGVQGCVRDVPSDLFDGGDDLGLDHYAEAVRVDIDDEDTAALARVRHVLQDAGAVGLDEVSMPGVRKTGPRTVPEARTWRRPPWREA
jgi:hypothetical protein